VPLAVACGSSAQPGDSAAVDASASSPAGDDGAGNARGGDATSVSQGSSGSSGGSASSSGGPNEGGVTTADASTGGDGGGSGCTPPVGLEYSYACWPMPNPASTGLPNPSSYTDMGDGTVLDNVTHLVWQKTVTSQQAYTWAAAQTYCSGLTLGGRAWHLPTRIELLSLVDFTKSPAIDSTAFPNTPGGKYHWTATPWVVSQIASKPQYSWMVNFSDGGLTSNAADRTLSEYVRCASSSQQGPLPNLYTQVASGEVRDSETGLVWVQATSTSTMSQTNAKSYCASLGLNGHMWRLPSIKELSTLVDDDPPIAKVSPAINTMWFADTPANGWYMSSSALSSNAWAINYQDGYTNHSQTAGVVRCVR
jgi:hypothetical protein